MKYLDASWHSGGDFPAELPAENGGTHIAMFLAWAISRNLLGELHREDSLDDLALLHSRQLTPCQFFFRCCDGKLTDEDFNDVGNGFAGRYYEKKYLQDYESVLGEDAETLYHIEDSWENFDKLKPVIDRRFDQWHAKQVNR